MMRCGNSADGIEVRRVWRTEVEHGVTVRLEVVVPWGKMQT